MPILPTITYFFLALYLFFSTFLWNFGAMSLQITLPSFSCLVIFYKPKSLVEEHRGKKTRNVLSFSTFLTSGSPSIPVLFSAFSTLVSQISHITFPPFEKPDWFLFSWLIHLMNRELLGLPGPSTKVISRMLSKFSELTVMTLVKERPLTGQNVEDIIHCLGNESMEQCLWNLWFRSLTRLCCYTNRWMWPRSLKFWAANICKQLKKVTI